MKSVAKTKRRWNCMASIMLSVSMLSAAAYMISVGDFGFHLFTQFVSRQLSIPVLVAIVIGILILMLIPVVSGILVVLRNEDGEEISALQQYGLTVLSGVLVFAGAAGVVWMIVEFDFEILLVAKVGAVIHCAAVLSGCFARHRFNKALDAELVEIIPSASDPVFHGVIVDVDIDAYEDIVFADSQPIEPSYTEHQPPKYASGTPTIDVKDLDWNL